MNRIFTYVCIYILYIYHKYQPFMDRSIYRTRPTLYGEASQRMQGRKCIRLFPPWAAIHLQPIGGWFGSPVVFCSQHEDVFGTEKEHGIWVIHYTRRTCVVWCLFLFLGGVGGKGWVLTWVLARCSWGFCNLELTSSCLCLWAYPRVNRCRINSPITLLGAGFNYFWILTRKSAETIQFWLAAYVSNGWWKTSTIYTWHDDSSSLFTW